MNDSRNKKLRPVYLLVAIGLAIIPIVLLMGVVPAAFGEIDGAAIVSDDPRPLLPGPGYLDFTYADPAGDVKNPTGEKPESKLWWNDGYWWGSMYNNSTHAYHIYRLMWGTQTWLDTGVQLDDWRDPLDPKNTKADTMWDAASGKLYVMSHWYTKNAGKVNPENVARLFRYSYDADGQTYTLDPGFPVNVNQDKSETLVMDKDSTGRLWTTFVSRPSSSTDFQVYVSSSNDDGANWDDPAFTVPSPVPISASHVTSDDISSLVPFNNHMAVVWSNRSETLSDTVSLALHPDSSAPTADWQYYSAPLPAGSSIDDHLSTKSIAVVDDKLFVAVKLAGGGDPSGPGIGLVAYDSGSFSFHTYSTQADHDTRPILVLDEDTNTLYLFVSGKEGGSKICYKTLLITDPASSMGDFALGDCGTEFMDDESKYKKINNATSMKGNASALTGIVVLAADEANGGYYAHNTMGDPPPVVDMTEPARNSADAPADIRPVSAIFSKEMNETTIVAPGSFVVKGPGNVPVAGTVSYDALLKKATFVPTLPLAIETTYIVELSSAIQDSSGTPLNEGINVGTIRETWQFTTLSASATPTVRFQFDTYTVNEGDGSATIEVSVFPPPSIKVTVDFSTSDGTATAPDDYTAVTNRQIEFNPGDLDLTKTVFVPIVDDNLNEFNETVNLSLSNASPLGVLIDPTFGTATLIIEDNDPEPDVMFTSNAYTAIESAGKVTLDVKLSAVSGRDASVRYETDGGSATPGVDYEETKGTMVFAKGQTVQSIDIPILDNNLPNSGKWFNVILIDDPLVDNGVTLNTPPTQAKVTITDQILVYLPVILGD